MFASRKSLVGLAAIVILWYLGLTYVPQMVGTCLDAECGFGTGEILVSLAIPLAFFALSVGLEMVLGRKGLRTALSDLGVTRFNGRGIRLAVTFLLPLLAFYPLFSLITNTPLELKANWPWFVVAALLNNGLAEETMMRGFVFRHLREGRPFWRAAALSTVYFAGYHLPLILMAGPLIGLFAVLVAIPTGFVTAYVYERGDNTIWGPALLRAVFNGLAYVLAFTPDVQPIASALYLLVGIGTAISLTMWAYRAGYGRTRIVAGSMANLSGAVPSK